MCVQLAVTTLLGLIRAQQRYIIIAGNDVMVQISHYEVWTGIIAISTGIMKTSQWSIYMCSVCNTIMASRELGLLGIQVVYATQSWQVES